MSINLKNNQNIFLTAYEVHNMINDIIKDEKNNNSLIGEIDYSNNCKNYYIEGGCYCN